MLIIPLSIIFDTTREKTSPSVYGKDNCVQMGGHGCSQVISCLIIIFSYAADVSWINNLTRSRPWNNGYFFVGLRIDCNATNGQSVFVLRWMEDLSFGTFFSRDIMTVSRFPNSGCSNGIQWSRQVDINISNTRALDLGGLGTVRDISKWTVVLCVRLIVCARVCDY